MENHLIIGLGGTGGKIIRSLRKTIFQEFRSNKPDDVNIGYLYLDTSDEMMQLEDPSWRVLGTNVQLDEGSKVFIKPGGLLEVLNNIKQYPGIKDWIGNVSDWTEFLNSSSGLNTAGGQRRRLGRFILACNISAFNKALSAQINQLQNVSGSADVHFHVCCGLAGGTGAGTLIDVLAQIRKNYRPSGQTGYRITLYTFLPEEHPKDNRDSGFYHSNGYAALAELNACSVGNLKPFDISTVNAKGETRLTEIDDFFNGAYLFSNINENGNKVDIDRELPNIVSDFLFQKLVSIKDMEWKKEILGRQENNENLDAAPEQSSTSPTSERSIRFLAFGVKRIAIPEEEIREYITYNFASQSVLQLRYNNWSDETGFRNEAVNQNFAELVGNKKTHENWRTTDEHLQLSLPIMDDAVTARWRTIGDTWRMVIPEYKSQAKERKDANWLDELKKLCAQYFNENYRNMGVQKFYEAKVADRKDLAREICNKIESELFAEWKNGEKSLFDIKRLLEYLQGNLQKRFGEIDDKLVKIQQLEERVLTTVIAENDKTWAKVGLLAAAVGKKDKLLDGQATALEELYIYKTQGQGLQFSKTLLSEVLEQLNGLKSQIDKANQTLDAALKEFEKNVNERCNDDENILNTEEAYKQQIIRFYDPNKVKLITKRFIRDKKEQNTQTSNVRKALIDRLGEQLSFTRFNGLITKSALINTLEITCDQNAENAEAALEKKDRLFDVGVVGKLREHYEGNYEELRRFAKKLVDYSGCFISFEQNEINKVGDGTKPPPTKIKTFTVVIPKSPEHQDFVNELERAFRETAPAGIQPRFVYTASKKYEITLLSLVNGFPMRYVSSITMLRNKYEERVKKDDGEKAKMFLHTEGNGDNLPRLFISSQKEIEVELETLRQSAIPLILLADAMGFVKEMNDDQGYLRKAIVKTDAFGDSVAVFYMDKKMSDCFHTIDRKKFEILKSTVGPLFESNFKHKTKKEELQAALIETIKNIKAERGEEDSIYTLHKAQASIIIQKLIS